MDEKRKTARLAGLFYFLFLIFGMFAQLSRGGIIVDGNIADTVRNITANSFLFRLSFVSDLLGDTIYIFLVLTLYKLLSPVKKDTAVLMTVLVFVGIPVAMFAQFNLFMASFLQSGTGYLKNFDPNQLQGLTGLFLDIYKHGIYIADIFWGLWLFPFGYLVFKSGFIPKWIGILLMAGCFGFLIEFFVGYLAPGWKFITYPGLAISTIAELSAIFWLLVFGIREKRSS